MNIRPVTPEDLPEIVRLNRVCGFPERSAAGWNWVLFHNPHQGVEPPGYVVEKDGRVAAFLGCAAHALNADGQQLIVVNGHTFISDLASPGVAIRLVRHFFQHSKCDGGYTLNNNALSAPVYKKCGMEAVWGEKARTIAELPLKRLPRYASAVFRRIARRDALHRLLSKREWFLTRPKSGSAPLLENVRQLDVSNADDAAALDKFSAALRSSDRLYGVRDADTLNYRMNDPDGSGSALTHATVDDDGISGLLITRLSKDVAFGVVTLEIEDLVTRPGYGAAIDTLIQQAVEIARHQHAARVFWRVIPFEETQAAAQRAGFHFRTISYDSCHLRPLTDWQPERWHVTGFDGDFWFALRKPPER